MDEEKHIWKEFFFIFNFDKSNEITAGNPSEVSWLESQTTENEVFIFIFFERER